MSGARPKAEPNPSQSEPIAPRSRHEPQLDLALSSETPSGPAPAEVRPAGLYPWTDSPTNRGRMRWRGGRRGMPTIAARDLFDARIVLANVTRAFALFAAANDEGKPEAERKAAHADAVGLFRHTWAVIEEICDRDTRRRRSKSTRSGAR